MDILAAFLRSRRSSTDAARRSSWERDVGAGSAIVNAIGPIRQVVRGEDKMQRRYLVIAPGTAGNLSTPVQVQAE